MEGERQGDLPQRVTWLFCQECCSYELSLFHSSLYGRSSPMTGLFFALIPGGAWASGAGKGDQMVCLHPHGNVFPQPEIQVAAEQGLELGLIREMEAVQG